MEITDVRVFLVGEPKLKAFVSIVLDRCFMINDIKVIQGREGLFISMPSRRKKNGEFKDVAHPLNNDTRSWLEDRILREYEQQLYLQRSRRPGGGPMPVEPERIPAAVPNGLDEVRKAHGEGGPWPVQWQRAARSR